MNGDLRYVIGMVNMVASAFIALILSIAWLIGVAIVEDAMCVTIFSVLVVVFFFITIAYTALITYKVDFKRGDDE